MRPKTNRKGFTLAELLIVVAIIAILVAIAFPIYTAAMDNVKETVKQANIRATKSAGIAYIANHSELLWDVLNEKEGHDCWLVEADVYEDGSVNNLLAFGLDSENPGEFGVLFSEGISEPYCEWLDMSSEGKESFYLVALILFPTDLPA